MLALLIISSLFFVMKSNVQTAYNQWAHSYDEMENKTRDLDKFATSMILADIVGGDVLEFGCGTGKNTEWFSRNAKTVTAVDFSEEMLAKAREKLTGNHIQFRTADITKEWPFENQSFDLVSCNLILEHVADLDFVFSECARVLKPGGHFFISELHPFKQYQGSKARFEQNAALVVLECFTHHLSDFLESAEKNNFMCVQLKEWFDNNDKSLPPRLASFLFVRK